MATTQQLFNENERGFAVKRGLCKNRGFLQVIHLIPKVLLRYAFGFSVSLHWPHYVDVKRDCEWREEELRNRMSSGKSIPTVHRWLLVDAKNMVVGRLATRLAALLMGKHKPTFSPHLDHGDNVVVINCKDLKLTGEKYKDKRYLWHTGFPGSQRSFPPQYFAEVKGKPEEVLVRAVRGMLPKNRLRDDRMARLFPSKDTKIQHIDKFPEDLTKAFGLTAKPKFEVREPAPMVPKKSLWLKN